MENKTSIVLVDDHALYREGLRELVSKWGDFEVVGEACNGEEACNLCMQVKPDMVLLDVKMPVLDGVTACGVIHGELPQTAIVMLSLYGEPERVLPAIANGARGYLLKSIYAKELHDKLCVVLDGGAALSDEVVAVCFDAIRMQRFNPISADSVLRNMLDSLTEHEKDLLRLVAVGLSNREIGDRLYIGESTVKKQLNAITVKLGLKNRVQAATFALRAGLAE